MAFRLRGKMRSESRGPRSLVELTQYNSLRKLSAFLDLSEQLQLLHLRS